MKYRQRSLSFQRAGVLYHSQVLANIETDSIHVPASAYLLAKALGGARPNSLNSYGAVIKSLVEEVEADPDIAGFDDLTDAHMTQYLEFVLFRERGVSAKTLDLHAIVLDGWFNWCYECGYFAKPARFTYYVSQDVELELKKAVGRANSLDPFKLHHKYIPAKEFDELLRFEPSKIPYTTARNELILRLGYESGLRASEVVSSFNLSLREISRAIKAADAKRRFGFELDIIGKGAHGGKVRTIHVPDGLKRKIVRFVQLYSTKLKHTQLICAKDGSGLNSTYASKIFRDSKRHLIDKSESEIADRWERLPLRSFHSLRHSYATNLARRIYMGDLKNRVPRTLVQERLGHSSSSTTSIYIHFSSVIFNDHIEIQNEFANEMLNQKKLSRRDKDEGC